MRFLHKKSLGQNFLNNTRVPEKMVDAAGVVSGDVVFEVGPGTGILTASLLERGARVLAIEADERAVEALEERFETEIKEGRLRVVHTDIKELDLETLNIEPHSYKVVANIPYYLSGFLFRFFLDAKAQPSALVFLVQKEVAERIARDEKESLLSLSVKVFGDPTYVATIKRGNFTPQPNVDSAIVLIENIGVGKLGGVSPPDFFELIHEGFKAKRKQLLGNLSKKYGREGLTHTFSTLNISPQIRAEDVPLEMWLKLCRALYKNS